MSGALKVGSGILLSRLTGFVRDATLAYYFGAGPHADVFRIVLRGPNILQNLLGEQTLSASFIPVYSRLSDEDPRAAGRFAGAIFGLLLAVVAVVVLAGVLLARPIIAVVAPGFTADAAAIEAGTRSVDRFELAAAAVRWIFPMVGFLVLSAWALGVLNSHRRFFLSYVAPVAWNAAIVAGLAMVATRAGGGNADALLTGATIGALIGGLLQFLIQLPAALRLMSGFRVSMSRRVRGVGEALRSFAPLVAARGVVQLSGWVDLALASFLAVGAISALGWAYTLYLLPVSLFAMSVVASELPELARRTGEEASESFARRAVASLRRVVALVAPTTLGYLAFGFLIVGAVFRRGSFGQADNSLVYAVLAGYSLGLCATTASRVLTNAFYALGETSRPARVAVARVVVSALAGAALMMVADRLPVGALPWPVEESPLRLGAVGLAVGSSLGAWLELVLLRGELRRLRPELVGRIDAEAGLYGRLLGLAAVALAPPALLAWATPELWPAARGALVVGCYALAYLGLGKVSGMLEPGDLLRGFESAAGPDPRQDR
jgi:putative peptidoglycan lipid II flippase